MSDGPAQQGCWWMQEIGAWHVWWWQITRSLAGCERATQRINAGPRRGGMGDYSYLESPTYVIVGLGNYFGFLVKHLIFWLWFCTPDWLPVSCNLITQYLPTVFGQSFLQFWQHSNAATNLSWVIKWFLDGFGHQVRPVHTRPCIIVGSCHLRFIISFTMPSSIQKTLVE